MGVIGSTLLDGSSCTHEINALKAEANNQKIIRDERIKDPQDEGKKSNLTFEMLFQWSKRKLEHFFTLDSHNSNQTHK